jgi:hypothetical protein
VALVTQIALISIENLPAPNSRGIYETFGRSMQVL